LLSISPTTQAAKIKRPLLVVQGANDPRVPRGEAEQIVQAVRGAGGEVWYLLAQNEGHGFKKAPNRRAQVNATVQFLEKHLLGGQ